MEPLALYIHWPFCLAKCPYCDFNSHVRERIDQTRFAAALRRELAWEAERLGRRPLASIFFGGGTPSLMDPATVAALIADATSLFDVQPGIEITLEANPTSVEAGRLAALRQAGVNRISLGVQSLDDADAAALGRQHSAGAGDGGAGDRARGLFPRISFDLIYARPGQTLAAWRAELRQAHWRSPPTTCRCTSSPSSPAPPSRRCTAAASCCCRTTISRPRCMTRPARRRRVSACRLMKFPTMRSPAAESRHNLAYWRYADYAGIGPGAHGRVSARRRTDRHPPSPCPGAMGRTGRTPRPRFDRGRKTAAARPGAGDAADGAAPHRRRLVAALPRTRGDGA